MFIIRNYLISLLVSFSIFPLTFADSAIRGFMVDATSAEPLPVANVVIEGMKRGAFTNLDGYFVIDHLKAGSYTLLLSHLGYHPKKEKVVVTEILMEPLRFQLIPETIELEEAVVTIEKEETRASPVLSSVPLDVATLRTMPSLMAETDVLRAVQTIPGVKSSSDISSGLYVRGGSPDQTLILMDHNVVYNPNHLFGVFSTFNADATKSVNLMKGGFPAEYGGRSGSVLEIITNEGNRKETEGMVSVGIVSAKASLEGPLPGHRGSYAVFGRRTYLDPIISAIRSIDSSLVLPDYYFYDVNSKLNFDLSNRSTLSIAGYWGNDNLGLEFGPAGNKSNLYLTWGNQTVTSRLRQVLSRNLFLTINGASSQYLSKSGFDNEDIEFMKIYHRLNDYSLKTDLEFLGAKNHRFQTGLSVNRYDFRLSIFNLDISAVDLDKTSYCYSAYVEDSWRFHPLFEIKPGIRAYYYDKGEDFRLDPRLACVYYYDTNKRFKIAGGRYSQFLSLLNFGESMSNFDVWVPIDNTIKPSYSDQIVLGFEWDPKKDLEFTTETYYTDMHNLTEFRQIQTREAETASDGFLSGGKGYAYGFEWMLNRKQGRWTGWLGYSLSWTKRQFPNTYVNHGDWYYPIWDRRHDFIVSSNYSINDHWEISGTWRYNTGQGFTQPLGIYPARFAGSGYNRMVINGDMNNYRFPADHRLDVSAKYKHRFIGGLPATLDISVFNVYSRRPYWRRLVDTSENPVEITDVKLLPIIPLVSYEVRF